MILTLSLWSATTERFAVMRCAAKPFFADGPELTVMSREQDPEPFVAEALATPGCSAAPAHAKAAAGGVCHLSTAVSAYDQPGRP